MKRMLLSLVLLIPTLLFAGEDCSKLSGTCRTTCSDNEESEAGAFEDCSEKQQCCVSNKAEADVLQCCVVSFDSSKFGPRNCTLPQNNVCSAGSGSKIACSSLAMCR